MRRLNVARLVTMGQESSVSDATNGIKKMPKCVW